MHIKIEGRHRLIIFITDAARVRTSKIERRVRHARRGRDVLPSIENCYPLSAAINKGHVISMTRGASPRVLPDMTAPNIEKKNIYIYTYTDEKINY